MLKWRDHVMQASLILFFILVVLVWNDIKSDLIKYFFYAPIIGSLTYATQVFSEERSFVGKLSGNLVGLVISMTSLFIAIKFLHQP